MSEQPLYEGKAKRLWPTENPEQLRLEFKDDATAFDGIKKATFESKGRFNASISKLIYALLEKEGIETHLIREIDETNHLVHKVEILMVEVIVRNVAAGSFSRRFGVEEGTAFPFPTVEFSLKSDELGDPMINDDQAVAINLASFAELAQLKDSARQINQILSAFFDRCGLKLVDFKLEFGRKADGKIVLADEISPDSCRLWDKETGEKMDKDRFRRDMGGLMEAYAEVLQRVQREGV